MELILPAHIMKERAALAAKAGEDKIVSFKVVRPTLTNTCVRAALFMEKHRSLSVSHWSSGRKTVMVLQHY